jgi:dTDP-4-amino-4,6-dideoxygalactose transaminase
MRAICIHHGLEVVPLDISAKDTTPKSVDALEQIITDKTVAIIFTHLIGRIYSIDPFREVCEKNNIEVIEDMAQSFYKPTQELSWCKLRFYSLGMIKNHTTMVGGVTLI